MDLHNDFRRVYPRRVKCFRFREAPTKQKGKRRLFPKMHGGSCQACQAPIRGKRATPKWQGKEKSNRKRGDPIFRDPHTEKLGRQITDLDSGFLPVLVPLRHSRKDIHETLRESSAWKHNEADQSHEKKWLGVKPTDSHVVGMPNLFQLLWFTTSHSRVTRAWHISWCRRLMFGQKQSQLFHEKKWRLVTNGFSPGHVSSRITIGKREGLVINYRSRSRVVNENNRRICMLGQSLE